MEFYTKNMDETIALGSKIGKLLKRGDVILLDGDLGAGKTTFTKGIGKSLGVNRVINSPTFTIMKMYEGDINLYHMDLYRLDGEGMDFDLEDYIFGDGISVIEWPNQAIDLLPSTYLKIEIFNIDLNSREIRVNAFGKRYIELLEELYEEVNN